MIGVREGMAIAIGGMIFGVGLAASGLMDQAVVLDFLLLDDLGLLVTMAAALAVATPIYALAPRACPKPVVGECYEQSGRTVRPRTVIGAIVFGVGWGVSGACPGAAIASVGAANWPIALAIFGMLAGAYLQGVLAPER